MAGAEGHARFTGCVIGGRCFATAKEKAADKKIQQLKHERQKLIANTASFKKYSNAYRDILKAGQRPLEDYLRSMESIVTILDQEIDEYRAKHTFKQPEQINSPLI